MLQNNKPQPMQPAGMAVAATYSGPLPPPAQLEHYERILPGAAERILAMVETEQRARLEAMANNSARMDRLVEINRSETENDRLLIETNAVTIQRGQNRALLIALAVLMAACVCAICGHPLPASIIGGGGIAFISAVFIFGAHLKRHEISSRRKEQ